MPPPTISVVLCTYGRPDDLHRCVRSLLDVEHTSFEVVVVDNAPDPSVPVELGSDPRVRIVHEPRRGLDNARNRGVREARGALVAYIDDDCEADPAWLVRLETGFEDPEVACVTGRVRPARLATAPQRWFEDRFTFDRGIVPDRFEATDQRPWFPLYPSHLGTGCNMAFRTRVLEALGGFDPTLDMGTRVAGGGDLDVFARLLDAGEVAVYAPGALVYHHHRERRREAVRQFHGYGTAVTALCLKAMLTRPGRRREAVRFLRAYLADLALRLARPRHRQGLPVYLVAVETLGVLLGPVYYGLALLEHRWRTR